MIWGIIILYIICGTLTWIVDSVFIKRVDYEMWVFSLVLWPLVFPVMLYDVFFNPQMFKQ
jgi:hypothetical protein